jgi:hypothetical protein
MSKEEETLYDKWLKRLKNNKIAVILFFIVTAIGIITPFFPNINSFFPLSPRSIDPDSVAVNSPQSGLYSLIVYVCDNEYKMPVPNALVTITESGLISKNTGIDGKVLFDKSIPAGEIHYFVAKEGFIGKEEIFNVTTEGKSNTLTINLEKIKSTKQVTHTDHIPQPKGNYNTNVVGDGNVVVGGQGNQLVFEQPDIPKFIFLEAKMDTGVFLGNGSGRAAKTEFRYRHIVKFNFESKFSKNKLEFQYNTVGLYDIDILPVIGSSAVIFQGGGSTSDGYGNRKTNSIASPRDGTYKLVILTQDKQSDLLKRILIEVDGKKGFQLITSK